MAYANAQDINPESASTVPTEQNGGDATVTNANTEESETTAADSIVDVTTQPSVFNDVESSSTDVQSININAKTENSPSTENVDLNGDIPTDAPKNDADSTTESNENVNSSKTTPADVDTTEPTTTSSPTTMTPDPTTTTIAPTTPTPIPEFNCTTVGRFPYPDSCEKYYYCWDTVHNYAIFSCHGVFDPVAKRCVSNYAVCASAPSCEADEQVLPYPDDKHSFFICKLKKHSVPAEYELRKEGCARGREFVEGLGYCKLIIPSDQPSYDDSSSSSESSSGRFECTHVGIFIDFSSETHYIECIVKSVSKGVLKTIRRKCPKNTAFSAIDKKCVAI